MLLSAVSVLVIAQLSSEIPEGLMNNPVLRRTRIVCWITNITNTHSEYVILLAFPLQQWLQERASMLGDKHTAFIVSIMFPLQLIPTP